MAENVEGNGRNRGGRFINNLISSRSIIHLLPESLLIDLPPKNAADLVEIIKLDGAVLCSYFGKVQLVAKQLKSIRKEVIEHSRKIPIEAYDNDLIQILMKNSYAFYKPHRGVIVYAVAYQSYSYEAAQELISQILAMYDETVLEVFGQYTIPKTLTYAHRKKLEPMQKRLNSIMQQLNERGKQKRKQKGQSMISQTESSKQKIQEISMELHARQGSYKKAYSMSQKSIQQTQQLKVFSKKILLWLNCKKVILLLLLLANLMIGAYFISAYY